MGVEPTLDQEFNQGRATVLKTVQRVSQTAPASYSVRSARSKLAALCAGCPTLRQSFLWFGCKLGCTVPADLEQSASSNVLLHRADDSNLEYVSETPGYSSLRRRADPTNAASN